MASPRTKWLLFALGGLLLGLVLGAAWRWPRAALRWPQPGATGVSTRGALEISFNAAVDPTGIEDRLSLSPPADGAFSWRGDVLTFRPARPLAPDTTYTLVLAAGARSTRGLPLPGGNWRFTTGHPRLIYLAEQEGHTELWQVDPGGGAPLRLTYEAGGVRDFAISPDGRAIAYSAVRSDKGADLWLIDADGHNRRRLADCSQADCGAPAWTSDAAWLVFERRPLAAGIEGLSSGSPRLVLVDLIAGTVQPLFKDEAQLGSGPRWSPDGRWLAFVDPALGAIALYDKTSGGLTYVPSALAQLGDWAPDGRQLVFTQLVASPQAEGEAGSQQGTEAEQPDAPFFTHLFRSDLSAAAPADLSGAVEVEDTSPTWSPDGAWLAFGRRQLASGERTRGQQLWLMRPDGSAAQALTDAPDINHGGFAWSPDGRTLALVRYSLAAPAAHPSIWLIQADGSSLRPLVDNGTLPAWVP